MSLYRQFAVVLSVTLAVLASSHVGVAQLAELPDDPSFSSSFHPDAVLTNGFTSPARQQATNPNRFAQAFRLHEPSTELLARHGLKYYFDPRPRNILETSLWATYTVDMVSTVKYVTHLEWYNGYNATYGVIFSDKGTFTEGGWTSHVGIPNRNAPAIMSAIFARDLLTVALNRRINVKAETTRSRKWKVIKIVSNLYVLDGVLSHLGYGINNFVMLHDQVRSMEQSNPNGCWQNSPVPNGTQPSAVCH